MKHPFNERLALLNEQHNGLIQRPNESQTPGNGIFLRYRYPVLTAAHAPLFWRYDLDERTNPFFMERFGINGVFNAGAIKWKDRYILMARVEGWDRKSFFAIAESPNGIDNFRFWDSPVHMPGNGGSEINIYDIRLTQHEDGWIYGTILHREQGPCGPARRPVGSCCTVRYRPDKGPGPVGKIVRSADKEPATTERSTASGVC